MKDEGSYIKRLIAEGENQRLDFKFEIGDSKKIARTLCAFSNTDGGTLLLGVKDNGAIAGVRTDEEYYMLEGAAKMYCKPEVRFEIKNWIIDKKTIVEVKVHRGDKKPYYCQTQDKWQVYIRVDDENLLANRVILKVWERQNQDAGTFVRYTEIEKLLFEYLKHNDFITLSKFIKIANLKHYKAENILINLICLKIIEMTITEKGAYYSLKEKD